VIVKNNHKKRIQDLFADPHIAPFSGVLLTAQPNIFYFTNFTGHDSFALLTPKHTILITDGRYDIQARGECPGARIVVRRGPITDWLAMVLQKLAPKNIGLFGEEITLSLKKKINAACRQTRFQTISAKPIHDMRQIKTADEIVRIKKALAIAEAAFLDLLNDLEPGRTENEVAAELEYRMRALGAEKASFETIVACGPNAAKPHARTSQQKITAAKPIIFDFGALADGYCSDLTRTVYLGKMPPCFKTMYSVCLEAQLAAIDAVKPGITADQVDGVARKIIDRAKFGRYFNHGLGHGLGLEVHEAPTLSGKSKQLLLPGMIVTVEPGIYIPGRGGVRIEDDVLITESGFKVLSSLPKAPEQVVY
jgi:Xaa-Pro aminopeptidase